MEADIQQAMSDIDRRIEKLNTDMENASAEAKAEMNDEIAELNAAKDRLAENLRNFGQKTEEEWDQFKANVKRTIEDIDDDGQL